MKYRTAYCYDSSGVNFNTHAPSTKNIYIEEVLTWKETAQAASTEDNALGRYINRHLWINGIGLIIAIVALIISAFLRNWYAIAITLVLTYGFMEMLITVIIDKRTSLRQ